MPRGRPKKYKAPYRRMILRLYRQFDLDLIYLYEVIQAEGKYDIQTLLTNAVRTYLSGRRDPDTEDEIKRLCDGKLSVELPRFHRYIQFHLVLDEERDADLIAFFDTVTMGYRNAVAKGIVRWYLNELCVYPSLKTTRIRFIDGATKETLFEHEKH